MLSAIGGSSAASSVTREVDQLFKKADGNRDGKITKEELSQAFQSDNVKEGSADQTAKVNAIFDLLDQGGKGYITKEDATAGLEKLAQAQPGGAEPPAHKAHGGGGGGGGDGDTATAAVVNPDPADTNQDGKVSMQEELTYVLAQYQKSEAAHSSQTVAYV